MAAVHESARRRHADKHAPAIVAATNKMVTVAWHMLKTKTPYESRNEYHTDASWPGWIRLL